METIILDTIDEALEFAGIPSDFRDALIAQYDKPHRFYHNKDHLIDVLEGVINLGNSKESTLILTLVALFHDIHYMPMDPANEVKSAKIFKGLCKEDFEHEDRVVNIIEATKVGHEIKDLLSIQFNSIDRKILKSTNFLELMNWSDKLFKDYQCYSIEEFKKGHLEFIEANLVDSDSKRDLIDYVKNKVYKVGFYPGSFNPFHYGHLSVLEQAENSGAFDKVVIGIGVNPEKPSTGNVKEVFNVLGYRRITAYSGLLAEAIPVSREVQTTVIRGMRTSHDLIYEQNLAAYVRDFKKDISLSYWLCSPELSHLSSSSIKSILKTDPSLGHKYIPRAYAYNDPVFVGRIYK